MTIIVKLVAKYAIWLYAICAFGILIYLRAVFVAQRERAQAMFSLERETAASRGYRAAVMIVILRCCFYPRRHPLRAHRLKLQRRRRPAGHRRHGPPLPRSSLPHQR